MKSKKVALNIQAGRKMIRCMSVDQENQSVLDCVRENKTKTMNKKKLNDANIKYYDMNNLV